MRRLAILLGLVPLVTGCAVERTIKITSQPPGATIRMDDVIVGTTPKRVPFDHYGVRRVTLYKDGFRTHSERVKLRTPWYLRFPLDIISEVALPFGWRDRRALHVDLIAGEEVLSQPSLTSVFERAEILRDAGLDGPKDLPAPRARELPSLPAEETPETPETPESGSPEGTEGEENEEEEDPRPDRDPA